MKIASTSEIDQDVAQFKEIEGKGLFGQVEIIVKVDPEELSRIPIDKDVIPPNIAVAEAVAVKKGKSFQAAEKLPENVR